MVELESEEFVRFLLEFWVFLFEDVLLASEMVVEDDLPLQVTEHLVADLVSFVDPLRDCLVPHLEVPDLVLLTSQIVF